MNRICFHIRCVGVLLLAILQSNIIVAQHSELNFEEENLATVFKVVEDNTDLIFNYVPEIVAKYSFSGSINLSNPEESITQLLLDTPLDFTYDTPNVIIYTPGAKEYKLCGKVTDMITQEPLIGVNIVALNTSTGTQTNNEGDFEITLTAFKNQKISFSYIGYKTVLKQVKELDNIDCTEIRLSIDQMLANEIVITEYILDGISEEKNYYGYALDYNNLSKQQSVVEHDILKTAQLLPGITSIDDSATNLQIRGSSPDQNLILWEGVPVYNAGHIFGMISAINPFSVDGVSIFKGAHNPKYDNRVGGIVDISLTDSIVDHFNGSVGTTLTELHTNLNIPIFKDRLSIVLSGRQSFKGFYDSPPLQSYTDKVFQYSIIDDLSEIPEENIDTEQSLSYSDWNAKLIYRATDRISFNLGTYSNQQDFNYSFSFEEDPFISEDNIKVETKIVNAEMEVAMSNNWSSFFTFYNTSYTNDYSKDESENGILLGTFDQINRIDDRSFSFSNIYKPSSNLSISGGYEYNRKKLNLDLGDNVNFDSDFTPLINENANFQNVFLSSNYTSKKISIDIGNRASYYEQRNNWTHSPRFNFQYFVNDHLKFKADGGIYHQFISQLTNFGTKQIRVDNPLWIINATDTQLSQKANKYAAGFVFRQNGWLFDVDAYYNHISGLSTLSPIFSAVSDENGFLQGTSTVKGIDVLLKKRWAGLNTWVNYSFGIAENLFPDISEFPISAPNDIRHNLSVVTSYKIRNFQFSLNTSYHSGLPYSRPDLVLNEFEENPEPPFLYFVDYETFNNYRLKDYLRLDLNVNYRSSFKNINTEISLSFINVLNNNNILNREYNLDYNDDTEIYNLAFIQKVLLDRTPLLLVRFYW